MEELTSKLQAGTDLEASEIATAADALLSDTVTDAAKADFLRALAEKGETPEEIAEFVRRFLDRAVDPGICGGSDSDAPPLLDVCGTGGDKLDLFNVSTATIFVLAAAGIRVVKHGNRGITSKSGGADVLEALGIRIDLPPSEFVRCVDECGAGFLFAPLYHPAFKVIVPVRKTLAAEGRRTIFNLVGPLLNPARPDYQLIGVFAREFAPVFAEILASLGRKAAWAVHGTTADGRGMDELSTLGESLLCKAAAGNGAIVEETVDPSALGFAPATLEDLQGGDAAANAVILENILGGTERGAKRDIVVLNAAAGLAVTGVAEDLADGVKRAGALIDSGEAKARLEMMRAFCQEGTAPSFP